LAHSPLRLPLVIELMGTSLGELVQEFKLPNAVQTNHPSVQVATDHRLDPFLAATYTTLSGLAERAAFFVLAPHALLDTLLPLAMSTSQIPILAQVPAAWIANGPPSRFAWLTQLKQRRQSLTINFHKDGLNPNAILVLFPTQESRERLLPASLSRHNIDAITIRA